MAQMQMLPNILRLPPVNAVTRASLRQFATCNVLNHKEIVTKEEDNKIKVEGRILESPRKKFVVRCDQSGGQTDCHPFCKSSIAPQVKHTDVLILDQFVDSSGQMFSQEDMKICRQQWLRLRKMVEMAQRSGLMPGKEFYCKEYRETKWGSQNCYWDEKTIDIQWQRNREQSLRSYFTKGLTRKPT